MVERSARNAGMVDESLYDRRCSENRRTAMDFQQFECLRRIEPSAGRDDVGGRLGDVRQDVKTRTMGHWREVKNTIIGRYRVDVGEVAQCHRYQIAMAEHRALRPAGRAAGIE